MIVKMCAKRVIFQGNYLDKTEKDFEKAKWIYLIVYI
jgi:hypothetical protein